MVVSLFILIILLFIILLGLLILILILISLIILIHSLKCSCFIIILHFNGILRLILVLNKL